MKKCVLFSTSELFDTDPDYEVDHPDHPPPGRRICNALIQYLKHIGVEIDTDEIPGDYWEHSGWYFFGKHQAIDYTFHVQTNCSFEAPLMVYIQSNRNSGLMKSLFGKSEAALAIDDGLLQHIVEFSKNLSDNDTCEVLTDQEASDKIWN